MKKPSQIRIDELIVPLILATAILGMNPVFGMENETPEERTSLLNFHFKVGDQKKLNEWVAKNGAEIYQHLNNHSNFGYPEETKNPNYYTKSEYWSTYQGYGENQVDFIKKKGISASIAIKSLLASEGRFDCRIAQRIVFLECMRRLMGDMTFDDCNKQFEAELSQDIFAKEGETRKLHLCGGITLNPYFRLTSPVDRSLHWCGDIGYFGYIPNIKEYAILHPYGLLRGDHALLCLDPGKSEKLYVGYGSFYKDGGLRWDDVIKRFKNETLTLSLPEKVVIKADLSTNPHYIRLIEKLNTSELQRKKKLIESLQNTYEKMFKDRQIDLWGSSVSYFIDLEKLLTILNNE